ncbi:hypothetical protein HK100_004278 [Physocladia obscura]|uniref:Uncharacterized protein n=1 Tax=Physocladia obscura TaxID=109957 RepID=A0AAD5SU21_9FUNG|nr:hypothetical protein HK100_004278 [Physocladia obscura]
MGEEQETAVVIETVTTAVTETVSETGATEVETLTETVEAKVESEAVAEGNEPIKAADTSGKSGVHSEEGVPSPQQITPSSKQKFKLALPFATPKLRFNTASAAPDHLPDLPTETPAAKSQLDAETDHSSNGDTTKPARASTKRTSGLGFLWPKPPKQKTEFPASTASGTALTDAAESETFAPEASTSPDEASADAPAVRAKTEVAELVATSEFSTAKEVLVAETSTETVVGGTETSKVVAAETEVEEVVPPEIPPKDENIVPSKDELVSPAPHASFLASWTSTLKKNLNPRSSKLASAPSTSTTTAATATTTEAVVVEEQISSPTSEIVETAVEVAVATTTTITATDETVVAAEEETTAKASAETVEKPTPLSRSRNPFVFRNFTKSLSPKRTKSVPSTENAVNTTVTSSESETIAAVAVETKTTAETVTEVTETVAAAEVTTAAAVVSDSEEAPPLSANSIASVDDMSPVKDVVTADKQTPIKKIGIAFNNT